MFVRSIIGAALLSLLIVTNLQAAERLQFDLPPQALLDSLRAVGERTGTNVLASTPSIAGLKAPALRGQMTADEAFRRLLAGSGLKHEFLDEKTVTFVAVGEKHSALTSADAIRLTQADVPADAAQTAQSSEQHRARQEPEESTRGVPEILVKGSKVFNTDIRRSEDDVQPYVLFEREAIERSGAANIEEFLKKRLTMNGSNSSFSQSYSSGGSVSSFSLRGLGTAQTLILVDGHRIASPSAGSSLLQSDLNNIPLAAIERIEVLPTTASGIYGGGATGGAINVILRRDYVGMEAKVTYNNTFDSDAGRKRVDVGAGFTLEEGRTTVLVAGSAVDQNPLYLGDRDFVQRYRDTTIRNNPAGYFGGGPPLAATTNIRSDSGAPLVLKPAFGGANLGSAITYVPEVYAGAASDNGAGLIANAGRYNTNLARTYQSYEATEGMGLQRALASYSLGVTLRREFTSKLQMFLDISGSNVTQDTFASNVGDVYTLSAAAPNNPFTEDILVNAPIIPGAENTIVSTFDRRIVGGAIYQLPFGWHVETDYTWNRMRYASSTTSRELATFESNITDGVWDVLRSPTTIPADTSQYFMPSPREPRRTFFNDAVVRFSGPLMALPAGAPTLSVMAEYRREKFNESFDYFPAVSRTTYYASKKRAVRSVYAEALIPLVSAAQQVPAVKALDFQLAGRYDEYTTTGAPSALVISYPVTTLPTFARVTNKTDSTDPTLGLRYQPLRDVILRASYGTGFLPPSITQLNPNSSVATSGGGNDPRRGGEVLGAWTSTGGGNPNLRPEKSDSVSMGIVYEPEGLKGFRVSLDYVRIDKKDEIRTLSIQQILANESLLSGRVTRAAAAPGDPYGVGRVTSINSTLTNVATAQVKAYDLAIDYTRDTAAWGTFEFHGAATRQDSYLTQLVPTVAPVENVGISLSNPLKLKANAQLIWQYHQWSLGWSTNYYHSYLVSSGASQRQSQGNNGIVPSQDFHDVFAGYRFDKSGWGPRWLGGTEVQAGIINVFNTVPAMDANNAFSGYYSPVGDARLANYYLSLKHSF